MTQKMQHSQAQNPLILRCHRLMEAFAKSDDERDFYLDRSEGFLLYVDLDKPEIDLTALEKELIANAGRYALIPKMTFYETKKIMEGFVNEKVYDIDTKEKLLELIQAKEARENFLEFIYDHHSELEKWQQYYQERSRIRIIEWLRQNHFEFVFEEDLDLPRDIMEKVKSQLFETKASKEVVAARKTLIAKAKTYYSNEALNPRPKRGRPPKQVAKTEIEPQMTSDIFTSVTPIARPFLFMPDYTHGTFVIFSQKFENEEQMLARKKAPTTGDFGINLESLNQKLMAIRSLSHRWQEEEKAIKHRTLPSLRSSFWKEPSQENSSEVEEKNKTRFTLPAKKEVAKSEAPAEKEKELKAPVVAKKKPSKAIVSTSRTPVRKKGK